MTATASEVIYGVRVRLSVVDLYLVEMVAVQRYWEATILNQRRDCLGAENRDARKLAMIGVAGEVAFWKYSGERWRGIGACRESDFYGDIEVRTSSKHHYGLYVKDTDPDDARFVLVTGEIPELWIRGWIRGREAKRDGSWEARGTSTQPAFWITCDQLHPMNTWR